MNKLAAQKRNRLAWLALGTTVVISLYWFLIIQKQEEWVIEEIARVEQARQKFAIGQRNAAKLPQYQIDLENNRNRLASIEETMPSGDVYRWLIRNFLALQAQEGLDIIDVDPPRISETTILPKVPYQQAEFVVTGRGYFHDIGRFIMNLENNMIHMRLLGLELEPAHSGDSNPEDAEKLIFKMQVSVLVKPESTKP
jgi:Tfp pilus assembly protein PilO